MNRPKLVDNPPRDLEGWVPVLVRLVDYSAVTQLVAAREAERQERTAEGDERVPVQSAGAAGEDPRLAAWPAWPSGALERLAAGSSLTARRWTKAMDAVAGGDAAWYTTSEVAELSGMTVNEWRDAPRKISRHLKAHFQDVPVHEGELVWPLRPSSQPDKPGEVSWGMPSKTKDRWKKIRGLSGGNASQEKDQP